MQFSVVIPTYNRAAELRQTLLSLSKLEVCDDWELIVVDNHSTDETSRVIREASKSFPARLRYLFEPLPGRSAALNAGIIAAKGKIIAITDDDVMVESDWLERAAEGLDQQMRFCRRQGFAHLGRIKAGLAIGSGGRHWSVIALPDYGQEPLELGKYRSPLHRTRFASPQLIFS